jgi:8-oxo-dGTP pyrophosphatase MutT (NUDIX family)
VYDKVKNTAWPEYLMVQRKDSLAYVEFIRGKYALENLSYIRQLLSNMTGEELASIGRLSFQELWNNLWMFGSSKCYMKEQHDSEVKLNQLKTGYALVDPKTKRQRRVVLDELVKEVSVCMEETEWGFPKGRRNLMESDKCCALREFREETGLPCNRIRVKHDKAIDEVFTGTNHVRYKHVYYIVEYIGSDRHEHMDWSTSDNPPWQASEIKDVKWFSFTDAQEKLKHINVERRELLKRVNAIVVGSMVLSSP